MPTCSIIAYPEDPSEAPAECRLNISQTRTPNWETGFSTSSVQFLHRGGEGALPSSARPSIHPPPARIACPLPLLPRECLFFFGEFFTGLRTQAASPHRHRPNTHRSLEWGHHRPVSTHVRVCGKSLAARRQALNALARPSRSRRRHQRAQAGARATAREAREASYRSESRRPRGGARATWSPLLMPRSGCPRGRKWMRGCILSW